MSLLARVTTIVRTHGYQGLAARAAAKLRRALYARVETRARKRAWQLLVERMRSGPVYFPRHAAPTVSVIVVATSQGTRLASCLNALLRQLDSLPCEVIVVDDAAPPQVGSYLDSCSGLTVLRNDLPRGFARSVARALETSRGRHACLLDENVIVGPACIGNLLAAFGGDERVAVVGAQLCAPDGCTVDAGGILWRDGTTSTFGHDTNARAHSVAFQREVDFSSVGICMVRTDALREVGGMPDDGTDERSCAVETSMRLRARGYRVIYEPSAIAIRFDPSRPRGDATDARAFAQRWEAQLAHHLPPDELLVERAARRIAGKRTVLVMDSFVPFEDRSAGARRMLAIMRMMRALGWHVIFVAHDGGTYEPYTTRARRLGIEVIPHRGDAVAAIRALPVPIDVAWIARPDVLARYLPTLRAAVRAPIVYDTVDLHYLRLRREAEVRGNGAPWEAMKTIELELVRKAEVTVVTSESDAVELAAAGFTSAVVPIVERRAELRTPFASRRDLLFLGNYSHEPNVDAALWLAREIMPRVWERMPDVALELAGADPTPAVQRLASQRVRVSGYVENADLLFDRARLFVAPLRYGAGMKGKVVYSIARGLPVVTTAIGAEGIALVDGESVLVRDRADDYADAIVELYNDERRWHHIADAAFDAARAYDESAIAPLVDRVLQAALQHKEEIGVDLGLPAHTA